MPSADPAIAVSPRHTTPSRSQQSTRPSASGTGFVERALVVGVLGAHHDREPEVSAGADGVTLAQPAQADAVVRVVVHRLEIERGPELALGQLEAARAVVGPRE